AALLVPAKSSQTAGRLPSGGNDAIAATQASPFQTQDGAQYFPAGHEFLLQNEADAMSAQNAPAPPGATETAARSPVEQPTENAPDNSPRVTSGPTLNGPDLGNPIPR